MEFVEPGSVVHNIYATYNVGWFYEGENFNKFMHPSNFRYNPMQQTATDILGLEYKPVKPKLKTDLGERPIEEPYVCFGIHATAQTKYWNNPTGWQELADYFRSKGKKIVVVSKEGNGYMNNYYPTDVLEVQGERTLENTMRYLQHSEMFIGVGSGLSWLSWGMDIPTVLISGFSWPSTEILDDNLIRVFKGGGCTGCFNRHRLDAGNWNWCPEHENTPRQFECSKKITANDVIQQIETYWEKGIAKKSAEVIIQESYELGMVQNHIEILKATEFVKNLGITNFIEIGTDQGGTFAIWSKVSANDGIRISVDLPHGEFGRDDYDVKQRDKYLKSLGSNVHTIHGSSHDEEIKSQVKKLLNGTLVDFLFIDGDHTYEGVKQDYEMYLEFVKPGGWIGFHDIKDTEFHRNANCRVDILWDELQGNKIEYNDYSSNYGGIGFIQKT
jgi:cephalosporin hydroxylase